MSSPNAYEKAWMKRVAEFAMCHGSYPDFETNIFQVHHVCGRKYKHNKIPIGHYFILPINPEYHDFMSNHELNVTHFRKRYTDAFGTQREQFADMERRIREEDDRQWIPTKVYQAIMNTRF